MIEGHRNAKAESLLWGIPPVLAIKTRWGFGAAALVWLLTLAVAWYHARDDGGPFA